jgi:hypothetical protein
MTKLYKIIFLFVGLIAMNIQVQAQLGVISSASFSDANLSIANYYAIHTDLQYADGNDWADISAFNVAKEVLNFSNYPNPASTSTTISYTLTSRAMVNLRVIDLTGKQLAVLIKQDQAAGKQEFYWELAKNNISPGMYILVLQVENKVYSRKIIVQ